jgi:hypothetical protein
MTNRTASLTPRTYSVMPTGGPVTDRTVVHVAPSEEVWISNFAGRAVSQFRTTLHTGEGSASSTCSQSRLGSWSLAGGSSGPRG